MTAVGFGMGDVVLGLVLADRGLLEGVTPVRPEVFVISTSEETDREAVRLLSRLRAAGVHARRSYRSTRNVGKLLGEASKSGACGAVIVEAVSPDVRLQWKDLGSGSQSSVVEADILDRIRTAGEDG